MSPVTMVRRPSPFPDQAAEQHRHGFVKQVQTGHKSLQNDDDDLTITVARDEADSIQDSLKDVAETMAMAVVISMIIIFLFFGDF